VALLRDLQTATRRFKDDAYPDAEAGEHIDERVRAEQVDSSAQQIADTWR